MQITLVVDEKLWRTFRGACIQRGEVASRLFEELMRETLKRWGVEVAEEPPKRAKKK
jgi:hypothetical protein